jgi:hypothetical protein
VKPTLASAEVAVQRGRIGVTNVVVGGGSGVAAAGSAVVGGAIVVVATFFGIGKSPFVCNIAVRLRS